MDSSPVERFLAVLRFLTIFPVPGRDNVEDLQGATAYFAPIGLLLGLLSGLMAWLLTLLFPPLITAILLTALLALFSGGLHLDGLADTGDGFFSSRPRSRMLEIMRDSQIGPMGVLCLFFVLQTKIAALTTLSSPQLPLALILTPLAGRVALVLTMVQLSYVRPEGGLATLFFAPAFKKQRQRDLWLGFLLLSITGGLFGGFTLFLTPIFLYLGLSLFSRFCQAKIQGCTGDTLGAACELAEALFLLILVGLL